MLISTTMFALVNTFVKFLNHIPAHELIFFRSIISLTLCIITIKKMGLSIWGNNRKWLVIRGFAGVTALTLFFITLQNISLANAVSIQYLSPLFTAILAIFLLKEKVKPAQWVYFAMAILGVVIIKGFDKNLSWFYLGLGVLSSIFAGLAYNAVRKCKDTDKPVQVVLYFPLIATPIMAVWCLFDWVQPHGWDWLFLLIIGAGTQVAQIYMTKALHSDETSKVTPVKYIGAIYAILIGYFVFDERLLLLNIVGIFIIVAAVLLNSGVHKIRRRVN
ncbi:DMT family transporter [Luteibaculum oceani]|uniref:DMT family transporter n=2 Tax=Luteibaculum oceani TaxID=1294296 RepID=A0A5C6V588_9FLAO|nr:DMT family transporter [Luteibaculum oceani]